VVNSLKHAFDGAQDGKISVQLHKTGGDAAKLIIEDNGTGMPENWKDMTSDEAVEDGLGTKIANLLTRQFGGSISYDFAHPGAPRPGTRVTLHLTDLALTSVFPDRQKQKEPDVQL
jgi:two-component sensor histidine kinase